MEKVVSIGTTGWCGLGPRDFSRRFDVVEFNWTFHERDETSQHFAEVAAELKDLRVLAVLKVSGIATHENRLRNPAQWWPGLWAKYAELQKAGVLGGLLWQLAPSYRCSQQTLEELSALAGYLPRNALHIFEFRHSSWYGRETVLDLLRRHRFCLAWIHIVNEDGWCGDLASGWASKARTCDALYLRMFGTKKKAVGRYSDTFLREEVMPVVSGCGAPREAYVVFAQADVPDHATADASALVELLGRAVPSGSRSTRWERDVLVATLGLAEGTEVEGVVQRISHRTVFVDIGRSCRAFVCAQHARRAGLLERLRVGTSLQRLEVENIDFRHEWGMISLTCHNAIISLGGATPARDEPEGGEAAGAEAAPAVAGAPPAAPGGKARRWLREPAKGDGISAQETPHQAPQQRQLQQEQEPAVRGEVVGPVVPSEPAPATRRSARWGPRANSELPASALAGAEGDAERQPFGEAAHGEDAMAEPMAAAAAPTVRIAEEPLPPVAGLLREGLAGAGSASAARRSRSEGAAAAQTRRETAAEAARREREAKRRLREEEAALARAEARKAAAAAAVAAVDKCDVVRLGDEQPEPEAAPLSVPQPRKRPARRGRRRASVEPADATGALPSRGLFADSVAAAGAALAAAAAAAASFAAEAEAFAAEVESQEKIETLAPWRVALRSAADAAVDRWNAETFGEADARLRGWGVGAMLRANARLRTAWAAAIAGSFYAGDMYAYGFDVGASAGVGGHGAGPGARVGVGGHGAGADGTYGSSPGSFGSSHVTAAWRNQAVAVGDGAANLECRPDRKIQERELAEERADEGAEQAGAPRVEEDLQAAAMDGGLTPGTAVNGRSDVAATAVGAQLVAHESAVVRVDTGDASGREGSEVGDAGVGVDSDSAFDALGRGEVGGDMCASSDGSEGEGGSEDGEEDMDEDEAEDADGDDDEVAFAAVCDLCGATHITDVDFISLGLDFRCAQVGAVCEGASCDDAGGHRGEAGAGASSSSAGVGVASAAPVLPPRAKLSVLTSEEKRRLFERYELQRQAERTPAHHLHHGVAQLFGVTAQKERYRDGEVVTRKGERFIKVETSLDPGPGCQIGGIIGWRTRLGRRGLGLRKMTKEEADRVCISNKERAHVRKAVGPGGGRKQAYVFEGKQSQAAPPVS